MSKYVKFEVKFGAEDLYAVLDFDNISILELLGCVEVLRRKIYDNYEKLQDGRFSEEKLN